MGTASVVVLLAFLCAAVAGAVTALVLARRRRAPDAGRRAIQQLGRAADRQRRRKPSTDATLDTGNLDARSAVDQIGGGF